MRTSRTRHGSGTGRSAARAFRRGWAKVTLFAAILAGVFFMHTAVHAEDPSRSTAVVTAAHAAGAMHAADGAAAMQPGETAYVGKPAADSHGHNPFGCDLTSMCLGLLAGAAVLAALIRDCRSRPVRAPAAAALRGWAALATAPPRPPSLTALSVSRT